MANFLVIGDLSLDLEFRGKAHKFAETAPEATVYRAALCDEPKMSLGMAGNVVRALRAFGHRVTLVSQLGNDWWGITAYSLIPSSVRRLLQRTETTTLKLRAYDGDGRMVGRWDRDAFVGEPRELRTTERYDGTVIVDYDKGVLDELLMGRLPQPIIVHSKYHRPERRPWNICATYAVCNLQEFERRFRGLLQGTYDSEAKEHAARYLLPTAGIDSGLVVTCGRAGAVYYDFQKVGDATNVPNPSQDNGCHLSGCGDVFLAGFASTIVGGGGLHSAVVAGLERSSHYALTGEVS